MGPRSGSSVTEPKAAGPSPGAVQPMLDADVLRTSGEVGAQAVSR